MRNFDLCFLAYLSLTREYIAVQGFSRIKPQFHISYSNKVRYSQISDVLR
jgi:hypothetical protein